MEGTGQQELELRGVLEGHSNWVTAIATPQNVDSDIIVSAGRDKKLLVWSLNSNLSTSETVGYAKRSLTGHSHFVSDVVISNDGCFAISGSWDKTLRLWDLTCGKSFRTFKGHSKEVHSVAFSSDNRQIVSGGADRTIRLWNNLGECKYNIEEDKHNGWISCVRFSPSQPVFVSAGWDNIVKVWNLENCKLRCNLVKHETIVNTVTISPDGSLCASGGKDGSAMLWDVHEGKHLYSLDARHPINTLCFSPCMYWLCAATDKSIVVWDLENKSPLCTLEPPKGYRSKLPWCTSLAWNATGRILLAGCSDGSILVYEVTRQI